MDNIFKHESAFEELLEEIEGEDPTIILDVFWQVFQVEILIHIAVEHFSESIFLNEVFHLFNTHHLVKL